MFGVWLCVLSSKHCYVVVAKFRCVYVDKAFAHSREEINAMTQCSVIDHNFNAGRKGTGSYAVVYSVQLKGCVYRCVANRNYCCRCTVWFAIMLWFIEGYNISLWRLLCLLCQRIRFSIGQTISDITKANTTHLAQKTLTNNSLSELSRKKPFEKNWNFCHPFDRRHRSTDRIDFFGEWIASPSRFSKFWEMLFFARNCDFQTEIYRTDTFWKPPPPSDYPTNDINQELPGSLYEKYLSPRLTSGAIWSCRLWCRTTTEITLKDYQNAMGTVSETFLHLENIHHHYYFIVGHPPTPPRIVEKN